MSELKHTFTSGRMDKDRDERLLKNGSYRDALNIQISSSEGSDVGAIENLLGNERLSDLGLGNATTIGAIAYGLKDKLYWFVTSDILDGIYEYDEKNNEVTPILLDTKSTNTTVLSEITIDSNVDSELILREYNVNELTQICGVNSLPIIKNQEVLINNNIIITSDDPSITISIPKNTVLQLDENSDIVFKNIIYDGVKYGNIDISAETISAGILNFSKNNLITGLNIIDDILFWTDNLNEPRRIHIPTFKKYTALSDGLETQVEYTVKNLQTKESYKDKRPLQHHDLTVIRKYPLSAPTMELYDSVTDGIVSIQESINLFDYEIGDVLEIKNRPTNPVWKVGDFVNITSLDGLVNLTASVKSITDDIALSKLIELSITSIDGDINDATEQYLIELKQKKALYELNFVRFAYRWKYKNGEYSVFSPFTEPAFISSLFRYDGKEAFNYGMINKLQRINLINFDKGDDTVEEIDILLKEGRNQNIYTLKTVKKLDFDGTFEITKEQIHSVVPNDQLLRQWDNVPKRAKAQEVTANRVIYGNYYQNYNVYSDPEFEVSITGRKDSYKRTIKSDRTYQLGVVYMDEYGRQTPVLSNDSATYKIDKANSIAKNKFQIKLNNQPPAWATHFKYFVKDVAGEYYNLAADRFYEDKENGFTYVSFPSSDRNKVTEQNYLLLKKYHGSDEAALFEDNRYKVIDIFSDPPEFVHEKLEQIDALQNVLFAPSFGSGSTVTVKTAGATPTEGKTTIQISSVNSTGTASNPPATGGVADDFKTNIKVGKYIRFFNGSKKTDRYKIVSVRYDTAGADECEIRIEEPFGADVSILYTDPASSSSPISADIEMRIYEDNANAGDKEFDGRFFVKLKTNGSLQQSIEDNTSADDSGIEYVPKYTAVFDGVDRNEKNYLRTGTSQTPFFIRNGGLINNGTRDTSGKRRLIGNKEAHITFEQTGPEDDNTLLRNLQVGSRIRFSNHDTIYRIGAIYSDGNFKYNTDHSLYRVDIRFEDADGNETPLTQDLVAFKTNLSPNYLSVDLLVEKDQDQIPFIANPAIFETEPIEQKTELDIYYETEKSFPVALHGQTQEVEWYNAISFGNGVESNRIRDDFNAIFIDSGVKASTVLAEPFKEEHKFNSLIWSGIINSRSGTNQSNQFNMANTITKDLLPSYGSVQKLFARDSDLVVYCEDKIVRALADKDILYNADGNANITASNKVIGNVIPFAGEYGISTNPESFCFYGFRAYNTDAKRGVVLRLSMDGLTPISKADMNDFFRDRLFANTGYLIGTYDNRNSLYNIAFENLDTVCFSESVQGWITRKSFIPEWAISLNDRYYSYNGGNLWIHDSLAAPRNNFYNTQYTSKVEFDINDDPSTIKKYKTIGYEGTSDWTANITTDQQKSSQITFTDKENKYFANIKGEEKTLSNLDIKNMSVQGIGRSVRRDGEDDYSDQLGDVSNTTATFRLILSTPNASVTDITKTQAPGTAISTIRFIIYPANGYEIDASNFYHKDITFTQNGKNIEAVLSFNSVQPNSDTTYSYNVDGKATKTPITVSGNFTILGFNYTIDTPKTGTFTVTGAYGTEQIISERIITADSGYFIENKNIVGNNSNIRIKKIKLSSNRFKIIESIFIPKNNTTLSYQVSITPTEEPVVNPILISKYIDTDDLLNDEEIRDITLFGEPNASFELDLSDSSSSIYSIIKTFDSTGQIILPLTFPAGNTAETYTITIDTLTGTDFGDNFGSNTITIDRVVRERKKIIFSVLYSSTITDNFVLEDYRGEPISNESFSFTLTLPAGSYVVANDPLNSDVIYGANQNGTSIVFDALSFDVVNTNELTISGFLSANELIADEIYTLDISSFVGKSIVTTFDVSAVDKNGASTGNFTAASTTYTVSGGADTTVTPSNTHHYFQLTPSTGYLFPDTLNADDFEILDSSNTSVLSTYAANNELLLKRIGDNISIGFKTKPFTQPTAANTFTIYPKPGTITAAVPVGNTIGTMGVNVNIESYIDGKGPRSIVSFTYQASYPYSKSYSNFDGATVQLFQAKVNFKLDEAKYVIDASQFSDANLFNFTSSNSELTLATAGTYPLAASTTPGSNTTITGPYEYNESTYELTINFLIDASSLGAPLKVNLKGKVNINLRSDKYYYSGTLYDKYSLVSIKEAGCDEIKGNTLQWSTLDANDNIYPKYWIEDPNAKTTAHPISKNLRDGVILYKQGSSSITKPGTKLTGLSAIIEDGFLSLFATTLAGKIYKGKECDIVPADNTQQFRPGFEIGGAYKGDVSVINQQNFWNDIAETEIELINPAYADQEIELTGTFKTQKLYEFGETNVPLDTSKNHSPHMVDTKSAQMVASGSIPNGNTDPTWMFDRITDSTTAVEGTNLANYNHVRNQLKTEAGLTGLAAEPLQGVDTLTIDKFGKGTWTKKILFDSNGKATFKVWAYRGARAYRIHMTVDNAYTTRYWYFYDAQISNGKSNTEAHDYAWSQAGNVGSKEWQADGNLFLNVMSMVRYEISNQAARKQGSFGLYQDYTILPWDINVDKIRSGNIWANSVTISQNKYDWQSTFVGYKNDGSGNTDKSDLYNGRVIIHKDYTSDANHQGYMVLQKYCDPNLVYPWSHGFADVPQNWEMPVWNPYVGFVNIDSVGFSNQPNDSGGYAYIKNAYKTDIKISRSELYGSDGESQRVGYNDYIIVDVFDEVASAYLTPSVTGNKV